jgi:hypothetical protein
MKVKELALQLALLENEGKGEYELFDSNGYPIISATFSEDDEELGPDEIRERVFIEAEF